MITIRLGKEFCEYYNETNGTNMPPKEIFTEVIAPIAFEAKEHLIVWNNSKFFQWRYVQKDKWDISSFSDVLCSFCEDMESDKGGLMDSLKVFGGCATPYNTGKEYKDKYKPTFETTSFCYCENEYFNIDERYYSWIGSLFTIGYSGFSIALHGRDYIETMWNSINAYRAFLNNNDFVKGAQIQTWNTIYFCLSKRHPEKLVSILNEYYDANKNNLKSDFLFEDIIFNISKYYKDVRFIELEKYGQMNVTAGAVTVEVPRVRKMFELFNVLYCDTDSDLDKFDFSKTFCKTENVFYKAIKTGAINENLFDPLNDVDYDKLKKKDYGNFIKYLDKIMKQEHKELANDFIGVIKQVKGKTRKNVNFDFSLATNSANFIKEINAFIDNYISGIPNNSDLNKQLQNIVEQAIEIDNEDFKLFSQYLQFLYKTM